MSDEESKDESTNDSEQQAEEKPTDSQQPSEQSEEQPAESDQPAEQSDEQPTETDQPSDQAEETAAAADQATEPSEEQPAESDQAAEQSGDATGGGGGGGGSGGGYGGGGPADDAFAVDSGSASKHTLQVIAKFTQDGGQIFPGDIKLNVYEYDDQKGKQGRKLFGGDVYDWQIFDITSKNQNTIYTPMRTDVSGSKVAIYAGARVQRDLGGYQSMYAMEVFAIPSQDTLRVKADVELENVSENVDAPNADKAKGMVTQLPKFEGKLVVQLFAKLIGRQYFRVSGKVYAGHISLRRVTE